MPATKRISASAQNVFLINSGLSVSQITSKYQWMTAGMVMKRKLNFAELTTSREPEVVEQNGAQLLKLHQ